MDNEVSPIKSADNNSDSPVSQVVPSVSTAAEVSSTEVSASSKSLSKDNRKPNIEAKDINVIYNKGKSNEMRALENINVEIFPQEYVIIFGPSGCGKSTLLYTIAGLQRPTSGAVKVSGEEIYNYGKARMAKFHRTTIGMVFQAFHLIGSLSVIDNVCLPKVFEGEDVEQRRKKASVLLERFNIKEQADKFPSELSGGQKQRVSIARSLMNNPNIILADEPVGNLDSKSSHNVMMLLKELNETDKKTIILVTHDPAHLQYGDKVIHMRDGKIIKIETVTKKVSPVESYVFKDGELKKELAEGKLVRDEFIPLDLKLLMRAFKSLSVEQVGALLVPFKSQQLFSHIFFSLTNEQLDLARKRLEDYIYSRIDLEKFRKDLDLPMEKGGAGWDKRKVEKFIEEAKTILDQSNKINFSEPENSARDMAEYLIGKLQLTFDDDRKRKLAQLIFDRIKNRIGVQEFKRLIDMPLSKEGLGVDKRTAARIARELEILLLLRYSA